MSRSFKMGLILLGLSGSAGLYLAFSEPVSDFFHRRTKIASVLSNPRDYQESVTIRGTVIVAISIWGYGGFRLRDETGDMLVVTKRAVPQKGQKVYVTGSVKQLFSLQVEEDSFWGRIVEFIKQTPAFQDLWGESGIVILIEQDMPKTP